MKPQNSILNELKEVAPIFLEIGNDTPYRLMEGYFENLPDQILEKAEIGLFSRTENQDFQVPEHYFDAFPNQVLQKIKAVQPVENANLVPLRKMRTWMTYAAAAMLTGVMIIGSFIYSDKRHANDFEKYKQMDIASALDQVTEADLNSYLENNPLANTELIEESEVASLPNTKENIQNLSNENLNHYLNENGYLETTAIVDTEN